MMEKQIVVAPCITRSPAGMDLIMYIEWTPVFHETVFQQLVSFSYWEIIQMCSRDF